MFSATVLSRVELRISSPEGGPWSVTFSPGIERFIGAYPRIDALDCEGGLLRFERVETAR
jgi:hypothetical protein